MLKGLHQVLQTVILGRVFIYFLQFGMPFELVLGDLDLKSYGVTAEPSLVRSNIKHYKDSALVMVTDGITFVMSNEEIADCVMLGDRYLSHTYFSDFFTDK